MCFIRNCLEYAFEQHQRLENWLSKFVLKCYLANLKHFVLLRLLLQFLYELERLKLAGLIIEVYSCRIFLKELQAFHSDLVVLFYLYVIYFDRGQFVDAVFLIWLVFLSQNYLLETLILTLPPTFYVLRELKLHKLRVLKVLYTKYGFAEKRAD